MTNTERPVDGLTRKIEFFSKHNSVIWRRWHLFINYAVLKKTTPTNKTQKFLIKLFEVNAHRAFKLLSPRIPPLETPTINRRENNNGHLQLGHATRVLFACEDVTKAMYICFLYFWIACAETSSVYVTTVKFNTYRFSHV